MNNRKLIAILLILLLPSAVFGTPIFNQIKCANSPDGKAQVINNEFQCDLEASFYNQDFLMKQSFGIVKAIVFYSNIRLDISPLRLMKLLSDNTIILPSNLAYLKIIINDADTNKEQILVISMTIQVIIKKTGGLCNFKLIDFNPTISDFKSPLLPMWLSKGIEKIINNNQTLGREILKLANTSLVQARQELGLCQK